MCSREYTPCCFTYYKTKSVAAIVISIEQDCDRIVEGKARIAHEFARVNVRRIRIKGADGERITLV